MWWIIALGVVLILAVVWTALIVLYTEMEDQRPTPRVRRR